MSSGVIARLRRGVSTGGNLEELLGVFQEEEATYPQRRRQLMGIRFYLRDFLSNCSERWWTDHSAATTYSELADEANRYSERTGEEVCYVTFNYDTLLDMTLEGQGLRNLRTIDGYLEPGGPRYIKAHGSVNWRRRISNCMPVSVGMAARDVVGLFPQNYTPAPGDSYIVEDNFLRNWCWRPDGSDRWFLEVPALAIPVETKVAASFEMPQSQLDALGKAIQSASRVLVIGWRASEPHFGELLMAYHPGLALPFTLVCGRDASETVSNLQSLGFVEMTDTHLGFNEFVDGGHLRQFLDVKP